jgi:hypothetical protein
MFDGMFEISSQLILKVSNHQSSWEYRLISSGLDLETPESMSVTTLPKPPSILSLYVPFRSDSIHSILLKTIPSLPPCLPLFELVGIEQVDYLVLDGCTTRPTRNPRPMLKFFTISVMR